MCVKNPDCNPSKYEILLDCIISLKWILIKIVSYDTVATVSALDCSEPAPECTQHPCIINNRLNAPRVNGHVKPYQYNVTRASFVRNYLIPFINIHMDWI